MVPSMIMQSTTSNTQEWPIDSPTSIYLPAPLKNILDQLPTNLYNTVYVRMSTSICNWASFTPLHNCAYVRDLADTILSSGRKVGIWTTIEDYTRIFQNEKYCRELSDLPFTYGEDEKKLLEGGRNHRLSSVPTRPHTATSQ